MTKNNYKKNLTAKRTINSINYFKFFEISLHCVTNISGNHGPKNFLKLLFPFLFFFSCFHA